MSFLKRLIALSVFSLGVGAPLFPQSFPADDPTLKRIWSIGMDSSHTQQLANVLFDSIGPRLTGSPGLRSASDWIISQYKAWGIDAKADRYGTWRGWRRGVSHIDLVKPRVRSLEGTMLAWSPGTKGVPVTAQAIILPSFKDSTEFVKWLPRAKGKIVLLSPALPTCRPSEDWARWATAESRASMDTLVTRTLNQWTVRGDTITNPDGSRMFKVDSAKLYRGTGYSLAAGTGTLGMRLEKAGVAGMITSRTKLEFTNTNPPLNGRGGGERAAVGAPRPVGASARGGGPAASLSAGNSSRIAGPQGSGGWGTIEVYDTYNTTVPAVTLTCEDYSLVYRLAENNQKPMVRLDLDASLLGEQPVFNTIGIIKGTEKPNEYVLLSAHLDSWDGSSGATDNGTGTLMVMEAMRILKNAYPNPKRTIIVGHWASEEQGLEGSSAFAEDHPEVMKGLQAVFNQDNGTGRVQRLSSLFLTDIGKHLKRWYDALPSFYTDSLSENVVSWSFNDVPFPAGPSSGTDGVVFACFGTPSIFMSALGWNYFTYTWHSNRDSYDKVVFDDLKHNATLAAMLAYEASEDPSFIDRTKSPGIWPVDWPASCGRARRVTKPRY